jgi:PIN domain nuclease of toxin-antitoxin system
MKIITLDTHVALWVARGSSELGALAHSLITAADRVLVSSLSIAELNMKAMLGKFKPQLGLAQMFKESGFEVVDFSEAGAEAISRFGALAKRDPFDRMILSQAAASGSVLFTADRVLLAQGLDFVRSAEI